MKAIQFDKAIVLDGLKVAAGDVRPLSELPVDHVACVLRLGYATEVDVPEPAKGEAKAEKQKK